MHSLLKNLAKRKQDLARKKSQPVKTKLVSAAPVRKQVALSDVGQQLQAQRLIALVQQQVHPCWRIPGGEKNAHSIKVAIRIRLNTDGSLRGTPRVIDASRMQHDKSFRVLAESAVWALQNPSCQPLKLPYDQYDVWKDVTFNFDPSEALGH